MTTNPNCFTCKYRRDLPGDSHSACAHPDLTDRHRALGMLAFIMTSRVEFSPNLQVKANIHGVRMGWFMYPGNFDPVWLEECTGHTPTEVKQ